MKLHRQLILVSLLTLCLPWAGCQYLREMDSALRESQSRALLATAEAVANRIASEPLLLAELTQNAAQGSAERQLYAHPLPGPLLIDGYAEDWQHHGFLPLRWQLRERLLQVRATQHQRQLYLLVQVHTPQVHYYHPAMTDFDEIDHLRLRSLDRDGRYRDFALVASAPGNLSAFDLFRPQRPDQMENDPFIVETTGLSQLRQEHAIKGVWQETALGYQVEMQIPWYLTQGYLGLAAVFPDPQRALWMGSFAPDTAPAPIARPSDSLNQTLEVFAEEGLRLRLASSNQWLLAEAGQLLREQPLSDTHWLSRLLRRFLVQETLTPADRPETSGRLEGEVVTQSLKGKTASSWYLWQGQPLVRVAAPVTVNGQTLGAILAEQTGDELAALTNTGFRRLVFYTLTASLVAGLGLLAYASWLSLRVRRLSRAVDSTMRDQTTEQTFVPSDAADELGDLSRSYHQLLLRVQEYTEYLRSLANKLSHELRTPLAVVRSSLDNLDQEQLSEDARTYAARAQNGAQRLSSILNAMSAANRIEEAIRQAEMVAFPLDKLLRDLTQAYQGIAPQTLECDITPQQNYNLSGAPDLIVQMIDKLFDNACDFCPPDGRITFSLWRNKKYLHLCVSNHGPLLPQHMQHQLFDALVSIRDKSSRSDDGKIHLGLGLQIVRLVAELHQAQVIARNRADQKGAEFEVIFAAAD